MLLRSLHLENILSFGPDGMDLAMRPLNVLIGPNGSGKSNLLEIIALLAAAPQDIQGPLRTGGGLREWAWKGPASGVPAIEVIVAERAALALAGLRYRLELHAAPGRWESPEIVERVTSDNTGIPGTSFGFWYEDGKPGLYIDGRREDVLFALKRGQSVLGQVRSPLGVEPTAWVVLSQLGEAFQQIRMFREWAFGRQTAPRVPQPADARNDFLAEDASNLGLVLQRLRLDPAAKDRLLEQLRRLYTGISDYVVDVAANAVQVFLQEGSNTIPATRLSDGTLRYLCLLAVLCHPTPPPLVCIEEPELGLHPDILPGLADLLRDASERMQLVVTTHSDILVDALTDSPESVVICEKVERGTKLRRLDSKQLAAWLDKYRLGELWVSGELGGNRW